MEEIQKKLTEKSRNLKHDFLYMKERYNEVRKSDSKYILVDINIKNFRYYNVKYGCVGGNEILDEIYNVLQTSLNEHEYIAYLLADSFIVLLQYEDMYKLIYERLLVMFDHTYQAKNEKDGRNIFLSCGLYKIEDKNVEFYDAWNYACISRKENRGLPIRGHSIEIYEQPLYEQYIHRMDVDSKAADAYKNHEFIAFLQPKIDLKTGEICGAEALLRWMDKNGEYVPLLEFLPILNKNSYIEFIDLDIFDQMCKYLDERIKANKKVIPISFNISKSSFYSTDILIKYASIFETYDIPKDLIEIEFMEAMTLENTEYMKCMISAFKEYGFRCSLDDFGNGYASLNVLLNAQFDIVKMDRQFFLNNLEENQKLVIQAVVNLIHSLHMKVVAEGVETEEHSAFLKACGCDFVQGFYYYKPMNIEDFNTLLEKENEDEEKK